MAFRSHTDFFLVMRNKAFVNRRAQEIYEDDYALDKVSLITTQNYEENEICLEDLNGNMPPEWVSDVEEIQFTISKLPKKIEELKQMHHKHLTKPGFSDISDEEHQIESLTKEITKLLSHSQSILHQIKLKACKGDNNRESKLTRNVILSLATTLQDQTIQFRSSQSLYLRQLKSREEWSDNFFQIPSCQFEDTFDLKSTVVDLEETTEWSDPHNMNQEQLLVMEENTIMASQREREVEQIVTSIQELNHIFRDLSVMVVDQGTVLDRIDCNIEKTDIKVKEATRMLEKVEKSSRRGCKMMIVLGVCGLVVLLLILLLIMES